MKWPLSKREADVKCNIYARTVYDLRLWWPSDGADRMTILRLYNIILCLLVAGRTESKIIIVLSNYLKHLRCTMLQFY